MKNKIAYRIAGVSAAVFTLFATATSLYAVDVPYPEALDSAAIHQSSLGSITENSLLLGNGDINALLYADGAGLKLRLTKNDVWDARVDTAHDPELAVINVHKHTVTGGGTPASWGPPYPCPLACAVLDLKSSAHGASWAKIRSEGTTNTWTYADGVATMSIQGNAKASCGWQTQVDTGRAYSKLVVRVSGTPNARYYLTVNSSPGGSLESGWKDTPATEQEFQMALPAGAVVKQVILYSWTADGALAKNNISSIELQGPSGNDSLDLSQIVETGVASTLDIRHAVATVPGRTAHHEVAVRALADRNVFLIEGDTTVTLNPSTAGFVPAATKGVRDGIEYIVQKIPADPGYPEKGDWPGMSFVVAKAAHGQRTAVAIVTSLESPNPLDAAIALAGSTLSGDVEALHGKHEKLWDDFWSASGINLADSYMSGVWYQNLYFMRCVSKAGAKPIGLFAGLVGDSAAWHGDFHLNYNAQQTYWGWYSCNHAELSEPYEWLISRDLTRAKWFARVTYNCGGAYFPYNVFMHEPIDPATCKSRIGRQVAFIPYTYTLGVAGWAVQNHWLHYKYYPSTELLRTSVYPLLKEVALFYADFAGQCQTNGTTGKIVLGPTFSPEHWNFGRDDGTCDIAFARVALNAAIESADKLRVDAGLISRWQETIAKLPDYPRTTGTSPAILDVAGVPRTTYNVPVPALPVYPAGDITRFSSDADRQIFTDTISTMSTNGNNSMVILAGARARLGMPDAYSWSRAQFLLRQRPNGTLKLAPGNAAFNDFGAYTENFAVTGVITELLLQSVHDTLCIFPAWPADQDAAFENLRAQGGFLVSAEQKAGRIVKLEITSTAGGKLRLINPWSNKLIERETKPGEKLNYTAASR